jgi:hypothetical protein
MVIEKEKLMNYDQDEKLQELNNNIGSLYSMYLAVYAECCVSTPFESKLNHKELLAQLAVSLAAKGARQQWALMSMPEFEQRMMFMLTGKAK